MHFQNDAHVVRGIFQSRLTAHLFGAGQVSRLFEVA